MKEIFFSILPIFIITLLGSGIRRYWLTADEFWRGLEKLSYYLLFPCILFNYISTAQISSGSLVTIVMGLIISTSIVSVGLVLYQRNNEIEKSEFTSVFQGSVRYNSYIFFGLGSSLYGDAGLAIVSVVSAYMIIFTNVISVLAFNTYIRPEEKESPVEATYNFIMNFAKNPLIIASILGFLFNYSDLEMNIGIKKALQSLADAGLATGLLNVGAGLRFVIGPQYFNRIMLTSMVKLLIMPVVTASVLAISMIDGTPRSIGILYSALPCASTAYILSKQLGGDADLMAAIITATTIFSVFTISFVMWVAV
ncbi:MAG UNVERIFIED_CONTAM: AEC family transporter [Rickettsiaceae bacterium]|jgi:predicted permease